MTSDEKSIRCLNCGQDAGPQYCPHCGQETEIRQGPLLEVAREVLSDWLSLDSRLLRSLRALLWPGRLSELYVAGKREPFLRPFRLYLLASLVLFSTLLTLEAPDATGLNLKIGGEFVGPRASGEVQSVVEVLGNKSLVDRWILKMAGDRIGRVHRLPRQEVLDTLFLGFRRTLPLTLILFVPFLALGLKLLYIRGRAKHTQYLDHLIFALHFQSALFCLLSAAWLTTRLVGWQLFGVTALVMVFVYLPIALRRFYGQSLFWTMVKSLAVLFVYRQLLGLVVNLSALLAIRES